MMYTLQSIVLCELFIMIRRMLTCISYIKHMSAIDTMKPNLSLTFFVVTVILTLILPFYYQLITLYFMEKRGI